MVYRTGNARYYTSFKMVVSHISKNLPCQGREVPCLNEFGSILKRYAALLCQSVISLWHVQEVLMNDIARRHADEQGASS